MSEGTVARSHVSPVFDRLSATLGDGRTDPPGPDELLALAVQLLRGDVEAALLVARGDRRPVLVARGGAWIEEITELQLDVGEGPCLDTITATDPVLSDDVVVDARWPVLAARWPSQGPRSVLSVPLQLSGDDRAALSFYSCLPGRFSEEEVGSAAMLGPFAALAIESTLHQEDADQLRAALRSSREIGTAIGILMARGGITSEQAFDELVHASQHRNTKLREIAAEVVLTGQLPKVPPPD